MSLLKKLDEIEKDATDDLNHVDDYGFLLANARTNCRPSDILSLTAALRTLVEAIHGSIARADDGGDSYNSRPIRDAIKEINALYAEGGKNEGLRMHLRTLFNTV